LLKTTPSLRYGNGPFDAISASVVRPSGGNCATVIVGRFEEGKAGARVGPAIVGVGEADDVRLALGAGALLVGAGALDAGKTEAGTGAVGLAALPQPASETSTATRQLTDATTAFDTP